MVIFHSYISLPEGNGINNVLLVEIEGPGAGIPYINIYHHLPLKVNLQSPLFINQPMGKGHL